MFLALLTLFHFCSGNPHLESEVKLVPTQDCKTLNDGIYSDPNDCHRYFHCSGMKTFYFRCYDGFVFDPCDLRCKLRDVCIPEELCSKNLQNLTQNLLSHHRVVPEGDTKKNNNDLTNLFLLQNDADGRDTANTVGHGFEPQNTGPWAGTPYYPPSTTDDFRQYTALPTTTEELRLAIVRSFNGIETAGKPIILNNTDLKHFRLSTSRAEGTTKIWSSSVRPFPFSSVQTKSNRTESSSHVYPTSTTTSNYSKSPNAKNETREFAADIKDKTSSETEQKKPIGRHDGPQATTGVTTTSTDITTQGTTEATMTYIVKVVFSRRHRPDSQNGDISDEGSGNSSILNSKSRIHSNNTTIHEEGSGMMVSDHGNASARIKGPFDTSVQKSNNMTPLNNSLEIDMQKQGDAITMQINSTVSPEEFDRTNSSIATISSSSISLRSELSTVVETINSNKMNVTNETAVSDEETTSTGLPTTIVSTKTAATTTSMTEVSKEHENNRSSSTISPSSKSTRKFNITTKSHTSPSFQTKRHEDSNSTVVTTTAATTTNGSLQETTYTRITTEVITVTLSPAARLLNRNVVPEEKTVMSNISLACNPTISSALCEKSDNVTREALASHCQKLACNNGGMYISLSNGHCGCVCQNGFKGETCLDLVDRSMCSCANGGRCVEIANETYTCRCPLGYLGNKCQYTIDDLHPKVSNLLDLSPSPKITNNKLAVDLNKYLLCMVNNCANGGICLKEIESGSSLCFCSHNFAGQYCEKKCINC